MSLHASPDALVPDVPLVPWPDGTRERERCRAQRRPCLLVLPLGHPAPTQWDVLDDWVRAPLNPVEVATRQSTLRRRHRELAHGVMLDHGVLRRDGAWVALSRRQQAVLEPLLAPIGAIVDGRRLEAVHAAAGGAPTRRAFDQSVTRLRAGIRPLGLRLARLRGGRFVVQALPTGSSESAGLETVT